ncbi:MAG: PDZ domain-containing protein [Acidobacteria bacterium]|nr:PDZ domain-containing protein [Acidobacteriota bacterium]
MYKTSLIQKIAIVFLFFILVTIGNPITKTKASANLFNGSLYNLEKNKLSEKDRKEVFNTVWNTINEKYYDPNFNGVNWAGVKEHYKNLIDKANTDEDFYKLLTQMVRELHDSHTQFKSALQRQNRKKKQTVSIGLSIFEVENKSVVTKVEQGSEAEKAGIEPGMIVSSIDGEPIEKFIDKAKEEIGNSSSERALKLLIYREIIAGEPDSKVRLGFIRADKTTFETTLVRKIVSNAPKVTSQSFSSGFGYINFNFFRSPAEKLIKQELIKLRNTQGLIIDLRNNGGGFLGEGAEIASYFLSSTISLAKISARSSSKLSAIGLPEEIRVGSFESQVYNKPIVILINAATASTSEVFSQGLQESGRAKIIGSQSCGCVLGVLEHKEVKGGGELSISEIGFVSPKGYRLEGNGVVPDKSITLTINDIRNHKDLALEEAEKLLRENALK